MTTRQQNECRTILADVSAYLDGELGPEACRAMTRHCRTCPDCADLLNGLKRTVGLCREAGDRPLPKSVRARARAEVRRLLRGKG
jgi:anti-sigma factor RsiW